MCSSFEFRTSRNIVVMQRLTILVLLLTALVAMMEAVPAPEPVPVMMPVLAVEQPEGPSEVVAAEEEDQVAEASELIREKRQRGGYYNYAPQYGGYQSGYGGYGQQGHHHHHGGHYHYHNGHYDWYPNY